MADESGVTTSGRTDSYSEATAVAADDVPHSTPGDTIVAVPNRRKEAQRAFREGDAEYSKEVHQSMAAEEHDAFGEFVKVMVFGGLDGIITTFAVVASIAGADLKIEVVLVLGFSNLLADGVSMAFGEYISGDAEQKYVSMERQREAWELQNDPEGEMKEMVDLYVEKGFKKEDAENVIRTMAKYGEFFVDHMMTEELGMLPPESSSDVFRGLLANSTVMFFSFLVFGLVPLLSYICLSTIDGITSGTLFGISCGLTAVALFCLGCYSSKFSKYPWYRQGAFVMVNGATAAAVAYLVGWGVSSAIDLEGCE
eukprot:m.432339 g.432339  ORF g.432339 m.432339 type:complete len:311 (+) comp17422_c0_seq1:294-1226(+)